MGTRNFHNENATHIFAVTFPDYEDEDTGEIVQDEFGYDDLVENLTYELKALPKPKNNIIFIDGGTDSAENRSYGSRVLGTLRAYGNYKSIDVVIEVIPVIRSGYYEGVNLDWVYKFDIEGSEYDEEGLNFLEEYLSYHFGGLEKLANLRAKQIRKTCLAEKERLVKRLEKIYTQYSEAYDCVGGFSDGTGVYEKVK